MLAGVSPGVVLGDAGYGVNSTLRMTLNEWTLTYVVGIPSTIMVCPVRADDPEPPRVNVKKMALSRPSALGAPSCGGKAPT
jgi:SRSO17 transposase